MAEMAELVTLGRKAAHALKDFASLTGVDGLDESSHEAHWDHAEQLPHPGVVQVVPTGGDHLIENGERIPQAALGCLGNRAQGLFVGPDSLRR